MIQKLQKKFIMITMGSMALVLLVLIAIINILNFHQIDRKMDTVLNILANNDGKFPAVDKMNGGGKFEYGFGFKLTEETQYETRYFLVKTDRDKTVTSTDISHIAAVSQEEAKNYAVQILADKKEKGYVGIYKYISVEKPYGTLLVLVDSRSQIQMAVLYIMISFALALCCLFLVFILVFFLSRKAVGPAIESMEKQKRFITDAGHEIKTPLAIISADADVLELCEGKSEWIDSIREQTQRLDKLVKNLLMLSKMDEENVEMVFTDFPVSQVVREAAAPFQAVAETQKKQFEIVIQPDLVMHGDAGAVRQLVSILVDNAVKYAQEGGNIRVSLGTAGKAKKLEVYNTGENLPKENLDQLFDRFYRTDDSRSRDTGGFGIGLSIARNIVQAHKGKIAASVEKDGKAIRFDVII